MESTIIDPRTDKPFEFVKLTPTAGIQRIREEIIETIRKRANGARASKYDAAQTTHQNDNHWKWADNLSPDAANSLAVRKKLRSRSRYETANNGYLKGIILTKSQDTIGSGPSLQVNDPRFTSEQRVVIEKAYQRRAKKTKQRRKLRQLSFGKIQDGESFAVRIIDKRLKSPVKTTQKVIECDQFSHYTTPIKVDGTEVDGVRVNLRTGEPEQYFLLDQHPGENFSYNKNPISGQWISEREVIHWFRPDRPWLRGVPETIATLPLWALLRRYTLAVVQNAEIAADFTVLLKSLQGPATTPFSSSGSPSQPTQTNADDWFDSFPIDRGLMTVLPDKYEATQLDPKQPVSMYDMFVNALIQEASRPLLVPRNMALGNSGGYNMASGALDKQLYISAINNERYDCEDEVLNKDLEQWWYEAIRTPDYFDDYVTSSGIIDIVRKFQQLREEPPDHVYRWDDIPVHTDPVKIAMALDILHKGGHLSDIDIQEGRFNRRTEDHYVNLEEQQKKREELGIAGANEPIPDPIFNDGLEDSSDTSENE